MVAMSAAIMYLRLLLLALITPCYTDQWLYKIYVDSHAGAVDNSSCWEGSYSTPCLSLNLALKGAQHYSRFVEIILQPGQHPLHNGSETLLKNLSQLSINGNGSEGEVVVRCQSLVGLTFFRSANITINNLSLIGCGKLQNISEHYLIQAALLFAACKSIYLNNFYIGESNGTGVVTYNSDGNISISGCYFSCNNLIVEHKTIYGRGGLVIVADKNTFQSFCAISNSTFTYNTATESEHWIKPNGFNIGGGGGISIVFRGTAANNTILINRVHLNNNRAQFGGGMFLAFCDNTSSNIVIMESVDVTNNDAFQRKGSFANGGGVFIGFAAIGTNNPFDNVVAISNSSFVSNEADVGGGISVNLVYNTHMCSTTSNKLFIENCTFDSNTAFQGSSAYLSQGGKCSQPLLNTTVCCSRFINGNCGTILKHGFILRCIGNVLLESLPQLTFKGSVLFAHNPELGYTNNVSALALRSSFIALSSSSELQFINNSAVYGAGMHLVGCSSISVDKGSTLLFKHNTASRLGSAIYVESCTVGLAGSENCFFSHTNSSLHPNDWGINITFIDNQLGTGRTNAIYIDTIHSCIWSDSSDRTFCWRGWKYESNSGFKVDCINQLASGPAYVNYTGPLSYTIYPGGYIDNSQFRVYDIWNNDITDQEKILLEVVHGSAFVQQQDMLSSSIGVDCSSDYTNQSSLLYIHPIHQFPGVTVTINFKQCNYPECVFCIQLNCDFCHSLGLSGACPYTYMNSTNKTCALHREGILCGRCSEGYSVAFNDPDFTCIECSDPYYGVAIYIFLELVPLLIMLTLMAVFHIKITDGCLGGFVLFSQMVSLKFPGQGYSSWLVTPSTSLVSSNCFKPQTPLHFLNDIIILVF